MDSDPRRFRSPGLRSISSETSKNLHLYTDSGPQLFKKVLWEFVKNE